MNENITRPASRLTFSILWMGSCLFGGFAVGSKVHNPLKMTTLHFEKVAEWFPSRDSIKLAQMDSASFEENQLKIAVDFKPFQLPSRKAFAPKLSKKIHRHQKNPWAQLDRAIKNLKLASLAEIQKRVDLHEENIFEDYSRALRELRRDFFFAMIPVRESAQITTAQSSAVRRPSKNEPIVEVVEVQYPAPALKEKPARTEMPRAKMATQTLSIQRNFNNPDPISNLRISGAANDLFASMPAPAKPARTIAARPAKKQPAPIVEMKLPVVEVKQPTVEVKPVPVVAKVEEKTAEVAAEDEVRTEMKYALSARETTAKVPDPQPQAKAAEAAPAKANLTPEFTTYLNPALSKEEKNVLAEALLSEQIKTLNGVMIPRASRAPVAVAKNQPSRPQHLSPANDETKTDLAKNEVEKETDNQTFPENYAATPSTFASPSPTAIEACAQLPRTRFINSMGTQVCPTSQAWISKNWGDTGWVKVEYDNSLPTLHYYPAPNTGSTLLLETNSLAFLGLKTGTRIMKGMGVIIGRVPDGYEVDFVGRAEEAEYFDVQGKKHFAMINAEPGPGVVQLISKQKHEEAATVFSPVLEDTITYLDLAAPRNASFTVKVVKSGLVKDPEVVGLTVGVSTQGKIQGITQTQGKAYLKNVPIVPGYPVYIDVSSKMNRDRGYTYRYLLKNRNRAGEYVVHQIGEKSLFHWIKQVKQGLSDQSAMMVGFFNRKRLAGFKEHYFVKTEPQTAKFGLEPLNYSVMWDGKISPTEPLEGDLPRFMAVQVPEGLSRVKLTKESGEVMMSELIPVSPRVIHVVSE